MKQHTKSWLGSTSERDALVERTINSNDADDSDGSLPDWDDINNYYTSNPYSPASNDLQHRSPSKTPIVEIPTTLSKVDTAAHATYESGGSATVDTMIEKSSNGKESQPKLAKI
jgi:hypothetical protein